MIDKDNEQRIEELENKVQMLEEKLRQIMAKLYTTSCTQDTGPR